MHSYILMGDHRSGNCYKAALILHLTGRPFQWVETDVMAGSTRTPEFLSINPNGRVPVLRLPDGAWLAESNAMLLHLAEKSRFLPADAVERARVYQWLFFEQYSHEPYVAVARFLLHFQHDRPIDEGRISHLQQQGRKALSVMDEVLGVQSFIAGNGFTVADMALYAYTHVAAEGGFDLREFPAVVAWITRVARQPGHFDLSALSRQGLDLP